MVSYKALNTIGKHLASQQDGIVGYGYAVKAVARTESGFTYTFECGGQGEFLQVVAMRKSVTPSGRRTEGRLLQ